MSINREIAEPPWRQLYAILRAQIECGELTGRVPGEKHLMQEYGLALATVRKATKLLRDEGWIVTVAGWGSYVSENTPGAKPS